MVLQDSGDMIKLIRVLALACCKLGEIIVNYELFIHCLELR